MRNAKTVAFVSGGAAITCGVLMLGVISAEAATQKKVSAKLTEFKIALKPVSVSAGKVTFVANNAGKAEHELVIVQTSKDAAKLTVSNGEASEKGTRGEVEDVAPGKSKSFTVTLKKGHYVLLCNIAGHYKAGMYANFTVK